MGWRWRAEQQKTAVLADELHDLLKLRSADLESVETPILDELIKMRGSGEVRAEINAAIAAIEVEETRRAAGALFRELGSSISMKERGTAAAAHYAISYDAFRRDRGDGRPSRLREVIERVAQEMYSSQLEAKSNRRWMPIAGLVTLILVAFGTVALSQREGSPPNSETAQSSRPSGEATPPPESSPTTTAPLADATSTLAPVSPEVTVPFLEQGPLLGEVEAECDFTAGEWTEDRVPVEAVSSEFVKAYQANGGLDIGCPSSAVSERGGLFWQSLRRFGRTNGGLLGLLDGSVLYLNAGQWQSYIRVGGGDGSRSPGIAGAPTGRVLEIEGRYVLELDGEVELVSESVDGSYYWVPEIAVERWVPEGRGNSQYGNPTGSPYLTPTGLRQDYENGHFVLVGSGQVEWTAVGDPGDVLPAPDRLVGRIIGAADGTGWLVDSELRRWWLIDPQHWFCAGGQENVLKSGLPGYAIHTLEYGGVATCPAHLSGVEASRGGLVITEYCASAVDVDSRAEKQDDGTWACVKGAASRQLTVGDVCTWQYGSSALGVTNSEGLAWRCRMPWAQ